MTDSAKTPSFTDQRAIDHLLAFLKIEGLSGSEGAVAQEIRRRLEAAGCKKSWIRHDRVHKAIGQDYEVGNLIVRIPGTGAGRRAERRLLMGHMDTVPLCRGAVPKIEGDRIVSAGNTALGGDNRTSIGALVTAIEAVLASGVDRPPLTVLCTVGEEVGLLGARHVDPKDLGNPTLGFNVDSGDPRRVVYGAIGADRWTANVFGRSSHAGVSPEDGISATLIAAKAIAAVAERGFFGLIDAKGQRGTSNVGSIQGGEASNQVTDHVVVTGECRSHSKALLRRITSTYEREFARAAKSVRSDSGECGRVEFVAETDYHAFKMPKSSPAVKLASQKIREGGEEPILAIANGGLDANYINAKGIPTVTLGAGQHHPHTVDEYVDIPEYLGGCRLLTRLATL
ncbi:MAG: M20/M25/M40 family metallo-hydrolase [Acidobacteriota bacterium]